MKVHYTGRHAEVSENEKQRTKRKLEKVHRVLGANRSLEAHVVLSRQRHLFEAEVTLRALNHTLVVSGQNAQASAALSMAIEKLEKQAKKNKSKLVKNARPQRQRDQAPRAVEVLANPPEAASEPAEAVEAEPEIQRTNGMLAKPTTVEEARLVLEEENRDYITFRDADSNAICVLVRRRDGRLDLIEAQR